VETSYITAPGDYPEYITFADDFRAAVTAAGVPNELVEVASDASEMDPWTQDFFETAYMSMPAPGGGQKVIRVFYRSANVDYPSDASNPLRSSGKAVFTQFRGRDAAGVQQYDLSHNSAMDSLDSMGNTETIPPYSYNGASYPLGRLVRGNVPSNYTDPAFSLMLESQAMQPPVYLDTSWLLVGHVDETISYIKVDSPRGWAVIANDARLAKQMLEDAAAQGYGDTLMFEGLYWTSIVPAQKTIQQVLDNTNVMTTSAEAAVEVDAQLETLKAETGITDAEIIRVPFLHFTVYGASLAYQPGTVNGTYLSDTHYAAPEPHGPIIDGKDIFKVQLEEALGPYGITVDWVEDWDGYHVQEGEIHCGSNSARRIPDVKWWETGR
jgi:protein-arginine deiminase